MADLASIDPVTGSAVERGLTTEEATERLQRFGPNVLPQPQPPSILSIFLHQFRSPLIYILLIAAAVSLVVSEPEDAVFIGIVLLVNGVIGSVQEYSARRAATALRKLEQPRATVVRDGQTREIESRLLVPDDVVLLDAGGRVPADLMLIKTTDLLCDESLLTGESLPVRKSATDPDHPSVDRKASMAFAGALIIRGRATGMVTATGLATEIGSIAAEIGKASIFQPPLMIRLSHFSNVIAWTVGVASLQSRLRWRLACAAWRRIM